MNIEKFQKLLDMVRDEEAALVVKDPPHLTIIIINLKKITPAKADGE